MDQRSVRATHIEETNLKKTILWNFERFSYIEKQFLPNMFDSYTYLRYLWLSFFLRYVSLTCSSDPLFTSVLVYTPASLVILTSEELLFLYQWFLKIKNIYRNEKLFSVIYPSIIKKSEKLCSLYIEAKEKILYLPYNNTYLRKLLLNLFLPYVSRVVLLWSTVYFSVCFVLWHP